MIKNAFVYRADLRTRRAATQAMLLQGRSWRVGPFCRDGWAA